MISEEHNQNPKSLNELSDEELNDLDMESLLDLDDSSDWISTKGEVVTGTVVQVDQEFIYLNYGQKAEGRVQRNEIEGNVNIHDKFNAIIVQSESSEGFSRLSINEANKKIAWDRLTTEDDQSNLVMEGKIKKAVNGGFLVDISGLSFFLPGSQLGGIKVKDISEIMGKTYDFKVIKLDQRKKSGVLSRRQLLDDRREEKWNDFINKYKVNDKVSGLVKGITDYGAFLEVEGIKGLLHVSDMTWKKNARPKDVVKKNSILEIIVLNIDEENQKVSFGLKQLKEDPWEIFLKVHKEGEVLSGRVTQLATYGAFIELAEGVEGLAHISELSWSRRIQHPKQIVKKGDEVEVLIIKIDEKEKRLSLSLKNVLENPWEKTAQTVGVNRVMKGKITKVSNFGAFVEIDKDVEGLIHVSDISWDDVQNPKDILKEGEEVEFKIMDMITEERKISCSIKHLTPSPWELLKQKYHTNKIAEGTITGIVPFGVFVQLEENIEGLVHVSHLSKQRIENISDKFQKGDKVNTVVLGVDVGKKRISLSIKEYDRRRDKETVSKYMKDPQKQQTMALGDLINLNVTKQ